MLETVGWIALAIAFACTIILVFDLIHHPQPMVIMNIVWPVTSLYWSILGLIFYFRAGRASHHAAIRHKSTDAEREAGAQRITWKQAAIGTSHCGAGCALADILVEFTLFAFGVRLFGSELWASFFWDFCAAWALGIVFQYFSIQPMRHLSFAGGVKAAIKADTLSILAFQVGMYLWMAVVYFLLFPAPHLHPDSAAYWFMMQVGMALGFLTSLPMNRLLLRLGWKESMG